MIVQQSGRALSEKHTKLMAIMKSQIIYKGKMRSLQMKLLVNRNDLV